MKKLQIILLTTLLAITFILTSCEELTEVSISERFKLLEEDLNNNDYDSLYLNFHPYMNNYDQIKDGTAFDSSVLAEAYNDFDFYNLSITGSSVSGDFYSDGPSGTFTATMKEDGENNWKIYVLSIDTGSVFTLSGLSLEL